MWNKRYGGDDYAYGTSPNEFFKNTLIKYKLKGKILMPAEGEGRNAVFAAKNGLIVNAFDLSEEGKKKALKLAKQENVVINYELGDFFDLDLINEKYDVAALIFAHFPPPLLSKYHKKISSLIKPGGMIILEGFSVGHLALRNANPKVGGPNKIEMLFSTESIKNDFPNFEIKLLEELEIDLFEGEFHNGRSKVIRFIGVKQSTSI